MSKKQKMGHNSWPMKKSALNWKGLWQPSLYLWIERQKRCLSSAPRLPALLRLSGWPTKPFSTVLLSLIVNKAACHILFGVLDLKAASKAWLVSNSKEFNGLTLIECQHCVVLGWFLYVTLVYGWVIVVLPAHLARLGLTEGICPFTPVQESHNKKQNSSPWCGCCQTQNTWRSRSSNLSMMFLCIFVLIGFLYIVLKVRLRGIFIFPRASALWIVPTCTGSIKLAAEAW